MEEKIKKLAEYLGIDESEIKEGYEDYIFEAEDGEEYIVCDEDKAYELAVEDIKQVYDDLGLESFTENFVDWILENAVSESWLYDITKEDVENYVYDMDEEEVVEECIYYNIIEEGEDYDIDDIRESLIETRFDEISDYAQYWIDMLGRNEFLNMVKDYGDVDLDLIAEECIKWDGIAHFIALYDGKEIDLGDGLYAYRIN